MLHGIENLQFLYLRVSSNSELSRALLVRESANWYIHSINLTEAFCSGPFHLQWLCPLEVIYLPLLCWNKLLQIRTDYPV